MQCMQASRDQAERLLDHGEQLLADWRHPGPIICESRLDFTYPASLQSNS